MADAAAGARVGQGLRWSFEATDLEAVELWLGARSDTTSPVSASEAREDLLHDVFLDTGDRRLQAAGRVLRISLFGDAAEASLDAAPATEDLTTAGGALREWLPDTAFAAPTTAPGPVGERLRSLCGDRALAVLYETQTYRRRYPLRAGLREVGQLSLDRVDVLRDDAQPLARRCSIEVTADPGAVSEIAPFVTELREAGGQRAAGASIEAGLLVGQNAVLARPQVTEADESVVGGFVAAQLRELRRALAAWELGARLGEEPEALHQMRVTTRRLRVILGLLGRHLPRSASEVRVELAWLAAALGEVRDLDVQLSRLEEGRVFAPANVGPLEVTHADLAPLEALLVVERDSARARLIEAFDSRRYRALLDSLVALSDECANAPLLPVRAVAPALIARRYRRVRRARQAIRRTSPPSDLHAFRIHAKRLRYTVELFVGEYGTPARRLARDARRLQDDLGQHQDAVVAVDYLRRLGRDAASGLPRATVFAMGVLAERQRVEAATLRGPEAARRFGRKSWPRLLRAMRRKRARVTAPLASVVLEAHGLGPGVTELPGSTMEHVVGAGPSMPAQHWQKTGANAEPTGFEALAEAVAATALSLPAVEGPPKPSAARRLVGGIFSLLG